MSSDSGDYTYPAVQPFPERCERQMAAMKDDITLLRAIVRWLLQGQEPSANSLAYLRMLEDPTPTDKE